MLAQLGKTLGAGYLGIDLFWVTCTLFKFYSKTVQVSEGQINPVPLLHRDPRLRGGVTHNDEGAYRDSWSASKGKHNNT